MARSYDVRTVALTLGVSSKWVDNLLSHHRVFGVSGGRQGVQRSVSPDGLLAIELTRQLAQELELPVHRAAALASDIVANRCIGTLGNHVSHANACSRRHSRPLWVIDWRLDPVRSDRTRQ